LSFADCHSRKYIEGEGNTSLSIETNCSPNGGSMDDGEVSNVKG